MIEKTLQTYTEKEEEFVHLLIDTGLPKNVAKIMVCLMNTPEATQDDIDHDIDIRWCETTLVINYMINKGWIESRLIPSLKGGRRIKAYKLAIPIMEIVDDIEKQKKKKFCNQVELIKKMRDFL
jgi:predicted transcriptional regulator